MFPGDADAAGLGPTLDVFQGESEEGGSRSTCSGPEGRNEEMAME